MFVFRPPFPSFLYIKTSDAGNNERAVKNIFAASILSIHFVALFASSKINPFIHIVFITCLPIIEKCCMLSAAIEMYVRARTHFVHSFSSILPFAMTLVHTFNLLFSQYLFDEICYYAVLFNGNEIAVQMNTQHI